MASQTVFKYNLTPFIIHNVQTFKIIFKAKSDVLICNYNFTNLKTLYIDTTDYDFSLSIDNILKNNSGQISLDKITYNSNKIIEVCIISPYNILDISNIKFQNIQTLHLTGGIECLPFFPLLKKLTINACRIYLSNVSNKNPNKDNLIQQISRLSTLTYLYISIADCFFNDDLKVLINQGSFKQNLQSLHIHGIKSGMDFTGPLMNQNHTVDELKYYSNLNTLIIDGWTMYDKCSKNRQYIIQEISQCISLTELNLSHENYYLICAPITSSVAKLTNLYKLTMSVLELNLKEWELFCTFSNIHELILTYAYVKYVNSNNGKFEYCFKSLPLLKSLIDLEVKVSYGFGSTPNLIPNDEILYILNCKKLQRLRLEQYKLTLDIINKSKELCPTLNKIELPNCILQYSTDHVYNNNI